MMWCPLSDRNKRKSVLEGVSTHLVLYMLCANHAISHSEESAIRPRLHT